MGNCVPCRHAESELIEDTPTKDKTETTLTLTKGKFEPKTDTFVPVELEHVYDGDTFWAYIDRKCIVPTDLVNISIRVFGIDTPENKPNKYTDASKATPNPYYELEKEAAHLATEAAKLFMSNHKLSVRIVKPDKYGGRFDGEVMIDDKIPYADLMINAGHARPYNGEKKVPFNTWYNKNKVRDLEEVYREMSLDK